MTTAVWAVGLEALGAHKKRPDGVLGANGKYCVLRNTAVNREDLFPLKKFFGLLFRGLLLVQAQRVREHNWPRKPLQGIFGWGSKASRH